MIKSPFKFLDSYTLADRNIFFGRDQEIAELYRRVFESKILLAYGVSGTGKSSLINCGLASRFDDSDWLPINVRRGSNIIESLDAAINKQALTPLKKKQTISEKLQSIYLDHFKPVFLIFDQFEELFIFGDRQESKDFFQAVKEITESDLKCRFIFIIRKEYLADVSVYERTLPELMNNRVNVEKISLENARQAIEGPCNVANIDIEEGFSEALLEKLCPGSTELELTYLQVYLDKIFRLSQGEKPDDTDKLSFTLDLLQKAGNVTDLLGSFLDEQIAVLDNSDKGLAVLKSFVSVKGTRRHMSLEEISEFIQSIGQPTDKLVLQNILKTFTNLRILQDKDQEGKYELRHDALAAKIFEKFTAIEKDIIEVRQFIENSWHNWQMRNVLLSADDLNYIAPYESRLYLSKEQSGLIEKSKNELVRVKKRRRNIAIAASITILVIFAGFTIWALSERIKAFAQSHNSKLLMLIAKAREVNFSNPTKAIRYAQLAWEYDSTNALANQTLSNVFNAIDSRPFYAVAMEHRGPICSALFSPDGKSILTASYDKTAKLWDLSGKCLVTFSGHTWHVHSAVFSSDGKSILTTSEDNAIKLWDLSGKCMATFFGHSNFIYSAVFSPDGKSILTASGDNTAKIWDLSGKCLVTLSGHSLPVLFAIYSPDGRSILTVSKDNTAKLWNLSGKCRVTFTGHSSYVCSGVFSHDGKSILTASSDNTAKLWDLSGKCLATLLGHSSGVWSAVFSPDGKSILTSSYDKTAKLWDLSGKCLATLSGHSDLVISAVFSPDCKYILTASSDKTAKLWDLSGKCLATLSGHPSSVRSAVFSPDGKNILTVSFDDNSAKLWDLAEIPVATLSGHTSFVNSAVFSPNGRNILTASSDKTAKLWDLSGKCLTTLTGIPSDVNFIVFSPDGKNILTASSTNTTITNTYTFINASPDTTVKLWNLSGKCQTTLSGHSSFIHSAVFSPDGKSILTASDDKTAKLWDLSGKCFSTLSGHSSGVYSAVFSPDGRSILTASSDETAKLWDLSGKCLVTLSGHSSLVRSAVFSLDGKYILTASNDKTAKLWDLSGKCKATFSGHLDYIRSAVFSPDGKRILTASGDGTAKLWDLSGKCLATFYGHSSSVNSAFFSPDGKTILTASDDKTAKLWDLSGKCLATISGHSGPVFSTVFSPDGRFILTASSDNTAKLWLTPSSISKWLTATKIGSLTPEDKAEINEPDDFRLIQQSDNVSFITDYADWYLSTQDTARAVTLYKRALDLNPLSVDKRILGDIYRKKHKTSEYSALYKDNPEAIIKDDISALQDTSSDKNCAGKFDFYLKRTNLYEQLLKVESSTENKRYTASNYNDVCWFALLSGRYNEALKAIQRGIELDSSNVYLYTNMPLCYLLTGQYDKAKSAYLEFKNKPWTVTNQFITYKEAFLSDIADLEKMGITHPDFEKIKELLKK